MRHLVADGRDNPPFTPFVRMMRGHITWTITKTTSTMRSIAHIHIRGLDGATSTMS
jgi:hypothetical protein